VTVRRTWISDVLACFTALIVISLDQWTKWLVVTHLSPPDLGPQVPLIGSYLTLYYTRNRGAAFRIILCAECHDELHAGKLNEKKRLEAVMNFIV
jgi:signal peptidase II